MEDNGKRYSTWSSICYMVKNTWKFNKIVFLYCGFMTLCSTLRPFLTIYFTKYLLEELMGGRDVKRIIGIFVIYFLIQLVLEVLNNQIKYSVVPEQVKVRLLYMREHARKFLDAEYKYMEDEEFQNEAETSYRGLSNDSTGVQGLLNSMFYILGSILATGIYIGIVSTLNIWILLYLIVNVVITYILTYGAKKYEHSKKIEISDVNRRLNYINKVMYDFSAGKEIRVYGIKNWLTNKYTEQRKNKIRIQRNLKNKYFSVEVFESVFSFVREGIVYFYLIYLVLNGELEIPDFTVYMATIIGFSDHLKGIIRNIAFMRAQNLDIVDLRNFLETDSDKDCSNYVDIPEGPYEVEFKDVSFHYPNIEGNILEHLSFTLKQNERIAIVGNNGAGKTTLIKLLCGFFDVTGGEILLNGINIQKFERKKYQQLISAIFQEINIFAFSMAENIIFQEDNYNQDKLDEVLKSADLVDKVKSLPNGFHTSLHKILDPQGVELSGGEQQRVVIARALYKDSDIMILDEPTAALDAIAEHEVYEKFSEITEGKGSIFISHRLASTRFCDCILMLENGQIIEKGTHEELLQANGKYAEMFGVQSKYYKEGVTY